MASIVANIRALKGLTLLEKIKAHIGIEGNEGADTLANTGAEKDTPDNVSIIIPQGYEMPGAKLSTMTQTRLYRGIIENLPHQARRGTVTHLDMTRWTVKERTGEIPTDGQIWKSLWSKTLSRQTRNFLWRTMHNAYKIGKYWEHIVGYESRALCPKCRSIESMEHILTECEASGQHEIWKYIELLYKKKGLTSKSHPWVIS